VRDSRYHGGFDHPVRAFLIGVTLLVLLFGGFAVGIEAGTHPIEQTRAAVRVVTINGHVQTITVPVPVVRTVINGHTSVVRLPGSVHREVVGGKTTYVYRAIEPQPGGSSAVTDSGASLFVVPTTVTVTTPPETVTTPPETVTAPPETVTVTVTETEPPPSSTDSSGTAQTGP
jgi:hypothetical protein